MHTYIHVCLSHSLSRWQAYTDEVLEPLVEALRAVCSAKTVAFLCNGSRSWKRFKPEP